MCTHARRGVTIRIADALIAVAAVGATLVTAVMKNSPITEIQTIPLKP
jgi:hypothetical protein